MGKTAGLSRHKGESVRAAKRRDHVESFLQLKHYSNDMNNTSRMTRSSPRSFLICIEMLIASIAHFYVFPHYEWEEGYIRQQSSKTKFGDR